MGDERVCSRCAFHRRKNCTGRPGTFGERGTGDGMACAGAATEGARDTCDPYRQRGCVQLGVAEARAVDVTGPSADLNEERFLAEKKAPRRRGMLEYLRAY